MVPEDNEHNTWYFYGHFKLESCMYIYHIVLLSKLVKERKSIVLQQTSAYCLLALWSDDPGYTRQPQGLRISFGK